MQIDFSLELSMESTIDCLAGPLAIGSQPDGAITLTGLRARVTSLGLHENDEAIRPLQVHLYEATRNSGRPTARRPTVCLHLPSGKR